MSSSNHKYCNCKKRQGPKRRQLSVSDIPALHIFTSLSTFFVIGLTTWWFLFGRDYYYSKKKQLQKRKLSSKCNNKKRKIRTKPKEKILFEPIHKPKEIIISLKDQRKDEIDVNKNNIKSSERGSVDKSTERTLMSNDKKCEKRSKNIKAVESPNINNNGITSAISFTSRAQVFIQKRYDSASSDDEGSVCDKDSKVEKIESNESSLDVATLSLGEWNNNDGYDGYKSKWEQVGSSKNAKVEKPNKPVLSVAKKFEKTKNSPTKRQHTTITQSSLFKNVNNFMLCNEPRLGLILLSIESGVPDGNFASVLCDLLELKFEGIKKVSINLVESTISIRHFCDSSQVDDIRKNIVQVLEDLDVKASLLSDTIATRTIQVGPIGPPRNITLI